MAQIRNETNDAFLSAASNLGRFFSIAQKIINQATSVLDAEAKDFSLKKSLNGPEMLGTENLVTFSKMMDGVVSGLGAEAVDSAPLTPTQLEKLSRTYKILR